ncbi:DUF1573 domain-containing protein [Puniceicoccus vermicola]|uniref:DUF1573 domain-containing protein n=1 Tax=Puniceicoccus vermicola TaxID=388746 RepID=UPI003395AE45
MIASGSALADLSFEERVWKETAGVSQEKVEFAFPFENSGETEVTITEIKSSCGCTTAKLDKKTYAPGESGEITGTFNIGSRQGLQRKTVRLTTDSVAQPQILLTLEVDIPKLVSIEPGMLLWRKGEVPDVKTLKILPNEEMGVEIAGIDLEAEGVSIEMLDVEPTGAAEVEGTGVREALVTVASTEAPNRGLIRITAMLPDGQEKLYFAHALVR